MTKIVVGVDGSDVSRAALRWAADTARREGHALEVVHAYKASSGMRVTPDPVAVAGQIYTHHEVTAERELAAVEQDWDRMASSMLEGQEPRELAQSVLERTVAQVVGPDGPTIMLAAVEESDPADALLAHADGASLLVVGSRGRGRIGQLVLGSVSQRCAAEAACPVVIVNERAVAA